MVLRLYVQDDIIKVDFAFLKDDMIELSYIKNLNIVYAEILHTWDSLYRLEKCIQDIHDTMKLKSNARERLIESDFGFPQRREIWISKNKDYIISELNNIISNVEDQHFSTEGFFRELDEKISKWKELYKL